jgi:hypothetical protein
MFNEKMSSDKKNIGRSLVLDLLVIFLNFVLKYETHNAAVLQLFLSIGHSTPIKFDVNNLGFPAI